MHPPIHTHPSTHTQPALHTWTSLLQACATTPAPALTAPTDAHQSHVNTHNSHVNTHQSHCRVLLDDQVVAETLLHNMMRLCTGQQLPEVRLGDDGVPAAPCAALLKQVCTVVVVGVGGVCGM